MLKSNEPASPISEPLRKLSKNDIYQTTDQWKRKALHKIGETSGLWVSWAREGKAPMPPKERPRPPVKPSSELLMNKLKERLREKDYREAAALDPKIAEEKKAIDFPLPDDEQAWESYETAKFIYEEECRDYQREEKLARETFPKENKKVFTALIDCISDASVEELRRSKEGEALFNACDSLGFFNLAVKEHEYLTPSISSAAVARTKDEFEGLRQKSEDSIIEHTNEFARRLDVHIKARGEGAPYPYADFDKKYLLLRSLYQPTWSGWIEYREANDNMPATYEELVNALKKAEATKILRSPSPIDPLQHTAHATSTGDTSPRPASVSPGNCSVCGATFCPKKPQHTRCERCQEAYSKQRKKERKEEKGKDTSKKGKPKPKGVDRKAHFTELEDELDSQSDHEDSKDGNGRQQEGTSFSCICSTRAAQTDGLIYLDNCSNLNVIRDSALALNARREKVATRISGSIPGTLTAQVSAEIGDLGRGCHDPQFSRNLISEDAAIKAGYQVTRNSAMDDRYYLQKPGRPPLVFSSNGEGTFSMPITEFRRHFSDLYAVANSTDVDRTGLVFTKRQRERAAKYFFDHAHCLNHLHHDRVITALRKGLITGAPYTEADVRNSLVIFGPCPACSKCKGTRHRQVGHYPVTPESPGERLAGDLFTIMGTLFSVISCRLIKLRCVTKLQNKGAMEITRAVRECVEIWKGYGAKPKVLSWDQEPALVHCAHEIWAQHGLRLDFTPPDAHERVAERDVRTIKEHVHSTILSLGHAVDDEMVHGIVKDTITLLNFFPNSETMGGTPRTFLDGERLDYERWSRVYAGQVAEFEIPYPKQFGKGTRREIGYVIGHQGDNPIVRLLPAGKKLVIRSGHARALEKSPAVISLIEQGITGAKRQKFNDLLAEINDFFENEPDLDDRHPPSPRIVEWVESPQEPISQGSDRPMDTSISTDHIGEAQQPVIEMQQPRDVPHESTQGDNNQYTPHPEVAAPEPPSDPVTEPRRSTRSGARKPPGFYSKLASGESVSDYTACHMRAQECSSLYGADLTNDAGITEVVNMIKVRKAALPTDYRKLSPRILKEALPSFMFYKAKDLLPGEEEAAAPLDQPMAQARDSESTTEWTVVEPKKKRKAKRGKKRVKIRGRWVGGGHRQQKGEILAERVAPTARGTTHSLLMGIAASEGRQLRVGDIPSAYLQADHVPSNGRPVYIVADRHTTELIIKAMPEYTNLVRPNGTMVLQVKKAMYGLVESAWLWYKELEKHLLSIGYHVSSNDRGLFYKRLFKGGKCVASNIASVHVDDIISAASPNQDGAKLEEEFWGSMESKWPGIKLQKGPHFKHLSWNIYQDPKTGEIRKSQRDYLIEVVRASGVDKENKLPCRSNLLDSDPDSPMLSDTMINRFRSTLQKVAYAREGRPDFDFAVCYLQSKQSKPTQQDWSDLEHLLGYIRRFPEKEVVFKPKDLQLRGYCDASFNITTDGRSYYGYIITLGGALVSTKGGRVKTVVRSSTEAEISAVNEIVSELLWCRDVMEELGYDQLKMPIREDNLSCITMLQKEPRSFHSKSRHVRVKWAFFRQEYSKRTLSLSYCPTEKMVADLLTKPLGGKAHNLHSSSIFGGSLP